MKVIAEGTAVIQHAYTGELFEVPAAAIKWQIYLPDEADEGPAEIAYIGSIEHEQLGAIRWELWEHPIGECSIKGTDVGPHKLIKDVYYELYFPSDEFDAAESRVIVMMLSWFLSNYHRRPSIGIFDHLVSPEENLRTAKEILQEHYPRSGRRAIEIAARRAELGDPRGWSRRSTEDGDSEPPVVPPDQPGLSFHVNEKGQIAVSPSGAISSDEEVDIQNLLQELRDEVAEFLSCISGSNAHPLLERAGKRYLDVLQRDEIHIDNIYVRGGLLQTAYETVADLYKTGEAPEILPSAQASLKNSLFIHGVIVNSTNRGKLLNQRAAAFDIGCFATKEARDAKLQFANAVLHADELATLETRETIKEINDASLTLPSAQRIAEISVTTNHNFIAELGRAILATITIDSFKATEIFSASAASSGIAIDAAIHFLTFHQASVLGLALACGPTMAWVPHLVEWVTIKSRETPNGRKSLEGRRARR